MDTSELRVLLTRLKRISEVEYADIVIASVILRNKLRVNIVDGSFLDVWYSLTINGRYAYHWERRHLDNSIFRHDNIPHQRWRQVKTFPAHFHRETADKVQESDLSYNPDQAIRQFLFFIRKKLKKQ